MKKICLIGATGFIGNNIYETLNKNKNLKIIRFSSKENKFIDDVDDKYITILLNSIKVKLSLSSSKLSLAS
mgnify:CR=1 FL=1